MKTYRWFFPVLVATMLLSCKGTSEEELKGDWQRRQSIIGSGGCHLATFVIGDKGYVCGGYNGGRLRRNEVYEFDHTVGARGTWTTMTAFPGTRRQQAVGFSFGTFGYVGTGWDGDEKDLRDFWRFDPNANFNPVANRNLGEWIPVAPLPESAPPRRGAIAFSLERGGKEYGYVGCGYMEETDNEFYPSGRMYLQDFYEFDPAGFTKIPMNRFTEIYGIEDESGELEKTLPGSWTLVSGYGGHKREGAAVFVIDNKAYICNGENPTLVHELWIFDPNAANESDRWQHDPPRLMYDANPDEDYDDDYGTLGRSYGVAFVAPTEGGIPRGHIVGGNTRAPRASSCWEYDHLTDMWVERTHFINHLTRVNREGMISFSFKTTGRAFAGMGRTGGTYYDDLWEFIPLIDDNTYNDH